MKMAKRTWTETFESLFGAPAAQSEGVGTYMTPFPQSCPGSEREGRSTIYSGSAFTDRSRTVDSAVVANMSTVENLETQGSSHNWAHWTLLQEKRSSRDRRFDRDIIDKIVEQADMHLNCESSETISPTLQEHRAKTRETIGADDSEDKLPLNNTLQINVDDWDRVGRIHRPCRPVLERLFVFDKEHGWTSDETEFLRVLMMEVIDLFDFRNTFNCSCEEGSLRVTDPLLPHFRIPTSKLAVSFQPTAIRRSAMPPCSINHSISVDSDTKDEHDRFAFLFIEPIKAERPVGSTQSSHIDWASEALSSIYQMIWFENDLLTKFFDSVRVFTIVLNVKTFQVRIHRTEISDSLYPSFRCFEEIISIDNYERTQACRIVQAILRDYVQSRLLPFLQDVFHRMAERGDEQVKKKRKRNEVSTDSPSVTEVEVHRPTAATSTPGQQQSEST